MPVGSIVMEPPLLDGVGTAKLFIATVNSSPSEIERATVSPKSQATCRAYATILT